MTQVKSTFATADGYSMATFIKQNATANAAATCTVTFSFASSFRTITAANFSGVATSGGALQTSCNDATCNAIASPGTGRTAQNITTTTANTLLIAGGVNWDLTQTVTGASSFTAAVNGTTPFMLYRSVTSTGTYPSGNFGTVSSSDEYISHFISVGLL